MPASMEIGHLEDRITEQQSEISRLETRVSKQQFEIDALKDEFRRLDSDLWDLRGRVHSLEQS